MNNIRTYKILYYLSFVFYLVLLVVLNFLVFPWVLDSVVNQLLTITNLVFVVIFTIFLKKKQLNDVNVLFPILFLSFFVIVIGIGIAFNYKLIWPNIHFGYYYSFILFIHLLLNIYSVLSFSKSDK